MEKEKRPSVHGGLVQGTAILTLALLVVTLIPVIGPIVVILIPLPILYYYAYLGRSRGFGALAVAFLIASLILILAGQRTNIFVLFMMVFVGSTLVLAGLGVDVLTAVSASVATLNNVGPGLAGIGAAQTYAQIPDLGKLVLVFNMVVGRLELWAILCLLLPSFWRQRGA